MPDTLDPALKAALPRPIRLHHPKEAAQADLFSRARRLRQIGSFGYECADFLEDIAAYLAAASPQAEIDRLREALQYVQTYAEPRIQYHGAESDVGLAFRDIARKAARALHPETPNGGQNA